MSVIQVGLVDTTGQLDSKLVQATAAALNVQVIRDLAQFWQVTATVAYLPDPKQIPVGVWPVFLVAELPPGEGGVHLDKKNQPYALVIGTPTSADWTIDASHETLEMLVDPAGNRLQVSRAIEIVGNDVQDANGQFEYLVEACDPCEGNQYAYTIQGVAVSDFITPRFYDPVATPSARIQLCRSHPAAATDPAGWLYLLHQSDVQCAAADSFSRSQAGAEEPGTGNRGKPAGVLRRQDLRRRAQVP